MSNQELTLEPMTDWNGEQIAEDNGISDYNPADVAFKSGNDWHERKEFPPAGTQCKFFVDGFWRPGLIIGIDETCEDDVKCVVRAEFYDNYGYRSSSVPEFFWPIKTDAELERDEDIRKALEHITKDRYTQPTISVSEYVEDAGYRMRLNRREAHNRIIKGVHELSAKPFTRALILDALGYEE